MLPESYQQYGSIPGNNFEGRDTGIHRGRSKMPFGVRHLAAMLVVMVVLAVAKGYLSSRQNENFIAKPSIPLLASTLPVPSTLNLLDEQPYHSRDSSASDVKKPKIKDNIHDVQAVVVSGFEDNIYSGANPSGTLRWFCAPDSWKEVLPNSREGRVGSWSLNDNNSLVLTPPAKKDFWRKTYYNPILIKDDGPILFAELDSSQHYTIETSFTLQAVRQFDQAGLMVRLGPEHWLKTGIEVVDDKPRLSCVVTKVYSDWSTQAWSEYSIEKSNNGVSTVQVKCQIRVHCRGTNFVVEAKMPGSGDWEFVRIAHLSPCMQCRNDPLESLSSWEGPAPPIGKMWAGVFAASPDDQQGGHATFASFDIRKGSRFEHNADGDLKKILRQHSRSL